MNKAVAQSNVLQEQPPLAAEPDKAATDLDHLENQRAELEIHLDRLKEANTRQAALKARLQQATRDVEEHLDVGRDLSTRLRDAIRGVYGRRGEKLAEFGLQPRRPRKPAPPPEPPPSPETTKPPEGQSPDQAATPTTEASI
jgi:hypothetical protein